MTVKEAVLPKHEQNGKDNGKKKKKTSVYIKKKKKSRGGGGWTKEAISTEQQLTAPNSKTVKTACTEICLALEDSVDSMHLNLPRIQRQCRQHPLKSVSHSSQLNACVKKKKKKKATLKK